VGRRPVAYVALLALVLLVGGWALTRTNTTDQAPTDQAPAASGVPTCPLATLPREATDNVRVIHAGGPFPFPRNDGVVFGNWEGHLPEQVNGYYHEFTVITLGAKNRSTRRIVTGGAPSTNPPEFFYTGDHYDSFCLVVGSGRR